MPHGAEGANSLRARDAGQGTWQVQTWSVGECVDEGGGGKDRSGVAGVEGECYICRHLLGEVERMGDVLKSLGQGRGVVGVGRRTCVAEGKNA